jgi:hypothetical protein
VVADLAAAAAGVTEMSKREKISTERQVSVALASATCALLGTAVMTPADAQEDPDWDFNTSLLYYGEDGDRVQDLSFKSLTTRRFTDDRFLTFGLTVDTLTGASPNGTIRQDVPQTYTRPSGSGGYTVPAGELPLDDTFKDTRVAITANWQQPAGESGLVNVGFSASKEYDYLHTGVNARYAHDFNQRNTTVSAGVAFARDSIEPVGGAPVPFTPMFEIGNTTNRLGDQDKDILDVVLGVSQVINPDLVVQMNYSYSNAQGYLNNPYKLLSLVDPVTGDTLERPPIPGGPSHEYRFEGRPDERTQHGIYTQAKLNMDGKVLDASYRYRLSLDSSQPLPAFASSDYRLGEFDAVTAGLKYGWKTRSGNDMSVRLEWYTQSGNVPADQLIGNQALRDNYPDLNAVIVQFSYRFSR